MRMMKPWKTRRPSFWSYFAECNSELLPHLYCNKNVAAAAGTETELETETDHRVCAASDTDADEETRTFSALPSSSSSPPSSQMLSSQAGDQLSGPGIGHDIRQHTAVARRR